MNQGPQADPVHAGWLKFDDEIKKYGLLTIAIASVVITATFGPQVLYLLLGLGGVAAFALYPNMNPERIIYGSVAGLLMVGPTFGPLGLIGGAALGHYLGKRYDQLSQKADQVVTAVGMVTAPIKAIGNAPSSIVSGLKSTWQATKSGVASFYNHVHEVLEEELDKQADLPVAPVPVSPASLPSAVAVPVPVPVPAPATVPPQSALQQNAEQVIPAVNTPPSSMLSSLKKGLQATGSGIVDFYNHVQEVLEEELDRHTDFPETPAPAPVLVPPAPPKNAEKIQAAEEIREHALAPKPVVRFSSRAKKKSRAAHTEQPKATDKELETPVPAVQEIPEPVAPRRKRNTLWGMDFPLTIM